MKNTYKLTLHYGDPAEQVGISWGQTFVFTLRTGVLILREQCQRVLDTNTQRAAVTHHLPTVSIASS